VADFTLSAAATTALAPGRAHGLRGGARGVSHSALGVGAAPGHSGFLRRAPVHGLPPSGVGCAKEARGLGAKGPGEGGGSGVHRIFDGVDRLSTFGTLAFALVLTAAYLAALAAALLFVGWGTGVGELTYLQASMIYSLALGATLLLAGILTQLGLIFPHF
jgi:hypothetical protein